MYFLIFLFNIISYIRNFHMCGYFLQKVTLSCEYGAFTVLPFYALNLVKCEFYDLK